MRYDLLRAELERLEGLRKEELNELQFSKLKSRLDFHIHNNPFYAGHIRGRGIDLGDLRSLEDILNLPFIEKNHILENYPFSSVPAHELLRFYQTTGTTGNPKLIPYSRNDVQRSNELKARGYIFCGIQKWSKMMGIMIYGPWAGGMMTKESGECIGPTIPGDSRLDDDWLIWAFDKHRPDYIVCIPPFLSRLHDIAMRKGIECRDFSFEDVFTCGDMADKNFRNYFSQVFDARIHDLYCLTEFGCVAAECGHGNLHYWADEFILEVLDPGTSRPTMPGEVGEIVITGLYKEAPPLIRYRTHDLAMQGAANCDCGSILPFISKIMGRNDNMVCIAGANIYPMQLEEAITSVPGLSHVYEVILTKKDFKDHMLIRAELRPGAAVDMHYITEKLINHICSIGVEVNYAFKQSNAVHPLEINILENGALGKGSGKLKKIYDRRY